MLMQAVEQQIMVEEQAAKPNHLKGLSKLLVNLMKRHPDITPFHLQTVLHQTDLKQIKNDPALKQSLEEILAELRQRPDLDKGQRELLQVGSFPQKIHSEVKESFMCYDHSGLLGAD